MKSVGFYNLGFIQDALRGGVISAQCNNRHAAGYEHKFIPIKNCMKSLSSFYKGYLEHEPVKHRHATDFYGNVCLAYRPSPALGALPLGEGGGCEALSSSPFKESFMSNMTPETPKI